jgi:hypothetical protein
MRPFAKLVYQTYTTYLPTVFQAQYYGMPNGKIYLIFSRFYKNAFNKSGLEFVFAEHNDYSYDYEKDSIISVNQESKERPVFAEHVDSPRSRINIFNISRKLNSYGEALAELNKKAKKMLQSA